jgi:hypothetical protein
LTLVIGVGGRLTAGKDAFADHLVAEHGFVKLGMSDTLAEALYRLNPWIPVVTVGKEESWVWALFRKLRRLRGDLGSHSRTSVHWFRYQRLVDELGYVEVKKNPEVRRLLQVLGTEVGRELLGQNIWVDAAAKRISEAGPRVVITGIRFPNELDMIEKLNTNDRAATSVWIERPGLSTGTHSSEGSLSSQEFEYVLDNAGTLEELHMKTSHLLFTIEEDFL